MENKAYSILSVKEQREEADGLRIKGIASTPSTDRVGDIVEPLGAKFKTPMPLILEHRGGVVGRVEFAKPQKSGIPFEAFLPYVREAGKLKDRIDEAIHSLKYRLIGAVSIGFKPLDMEPIDKSNPYGGQRIKLWEWLELSLVTIPANQEATITSIKSLDLAQRRAVSGTTVVRVTPSAVAGSQSPTLSHKDTHKMTTLQESLSAAEKRRADLAAAHELALNAVMEKGETLDSDAQAEQSKQLEDIEKLDNYIDHLKRSEAVLTKARPVQNTANVGNGVGLPYASVKQNKEPGIAFAQAMRCLYKAGGVPYIAAEIAKKDYRDDRRVEIMLKADVPAGATVTGNWGADFVNSEGGPFQEFLEYLRPRTIIGRIPNLTRVEFLKPVGVQTSGGEGYWVGEGKTKPLTSIAAAPTSLPPTKVANIIAVTEEWLKYASPNNDRRIRDSMAGALQQRLDEDLIDPTVTVTNGVRPAAITNGAATTAATGSGDFADVITDFKWLIGQVTSVGLTRQPVLIMNETVALSLSLMVNAMGAPYFPNMMMSGGTFISGIPVIVSDSVPHATAGGTVVIVNAPDILLADEGGFDIAMSREASLLMTDDSPNTDMDSVTPNPASLVSMFQTNSVAFRAERAIGWKRARANAVAYLTSVAWGAA